MTPVRAESRDIWAKAQHVYERYKLAWMFWLGFAAVFTWFGRSVVQPLQAVPAVQAQQARQDTVMKANFDTVKSRLDAADEDRRDMTQLLRIYGKILCIQTDPTDRYKYGIKCSDIPMPKPPPGEN